MHFSILVILVIRFRIGLSSSFTLRKLKHVVCHLSACHFSIGTNWSITRFPERETLKSDHYNRS